jgi:hypothetical protein
LESGAVGLAIVLKFQVYPGNILLRAAAVSFMEITIIIIIITVIAKIQYMTLTCEITLHVAQIVLVRNSCNTT